LYWAGVQGKATQQDGDGVESKSQNWEKPPGENFFTKAALPESHRVKCGDSVEKDCSDKINFIRTHLKC
jgi:hypothetical protein